MVIIKKFKPLISVTPFDPLFAPATFYPSKGRTARERFRP